MFKQKLNLFQRVRVMIVALVAIIGLGTMAMKPAEKAHNYTYGVAETASGTEWVIVADVTGQIKGQDYFCDGTPMSTCTIYSDSNISTGSKIPRNPEVALAPGIFEKF